ncbi:MAG: hypothetical protein R2882_10090 [Gemmatimonadales bacterium]
MSLAASIRAVRSRSPDRPLIGRLALAAGFTPDHLAVFLQAALLDRLPQHRIEVDTGLFGDLA